MLKLANKIAIAIAVFVLASSANAAQTLKIETHFAANQPSGEVAAQ
ncbi:MAG: hypothetical protein RLZZ37_61, partial [Actinomycetota bacterium]